MEPIQVTCAEAGCRGCDHQHWTAKDTTRKGPTRDRQAHAPKDRSTQ